MYSQIIFFLLLTRANARCEWQLLQHPSCVSCIYLYMQQKQLSIIKKVGGTGGVHEEEGGNNLIDMILLSDFYQSSLGKNNLTGMREMIYTI